MLKRKLVLIFGSLVGVLILTAVWAVWLLQGVLGQMRHLEAEAWGVIDRANELSRMISVVEVELHEVEPGSRRPLAGLKEMMGAMRGHVEAVGASHVSDLPENAAMLQQIGARLPVLGRQVEALEAAGSAEAAGRFQREAIGTAIALRGEILVLAEAVRQHGGREQAELISRFRWIVLGICIIFLVVINLSVMALLRMAGMIIGPVEKLMQATRELAQERFDYRVELDQKDEFDELARAYNSLAAQLQANEQRKLETLQQVALALNHELNNAIAIIELQLQLLERPGARDGSVERYGRQIHQSLARMTRTVESLKRVRRIVLTDYVSGVKMLDLERSVADDADESAAPVAGDALGDAGRT